MTRIDGPLIESAPLAWRLAPQLCRRDPATGENCAWSHGIWQYLRLLGLVGSIESRAEFYAQAIERVTAAGATPRVLLSGTADYALLALVLRGYRRLGVAPAITVTDLCETPLALNRWYAERLSIGLETVQSDILGYSAAVPFDAICSDAFFGRFAVNERPALVASWRALLRPGGAVITTGRLRPGAAQRAVFSPDDVRAFRAAAHRSALEFPEPLGIDPLELARRAEAYAARHYTYAIGSAGEVRELFERGGFKVDFLSEVATGGGGGSHGAIGPTVRGSPRTTLHIVATRV